MRLPKVREIFLAATLSLCGCEALKTALPVIESILVDVLDAENKTNLAEKLANDFLAAHPDPALKAKVDAQIAKCRAGLQVALDVANGTNAAANGDTKTAFSSFNIAWLELEALTQPMSIIRVPGAEMAAQDHLVVDEPFSLKDSK